ncbi:MAG TPA: hypothetical protein EYH49_01495 [Aquifex aeolicus]|nr:hypothetical protein [Aquifex aeolicus]
MEFFFFLDVYADRQLIDYYILSFRLGNLKSVELKEWSGKKYIVGVKNWERFKDTAYDIVLYELGDEIERFKDIETALKEGYRIAYREASRVGAKRILPAIGYGNPPPELAKRFFPVEPEFESFPKDVDKFLEDVVKSIPRELSRRGFPDEEIPF